MIKDGDFATPAIVCRAKGGICFLNGKCGTCELARKYAVSKLFFEMMEECNYRNSEDICTCTLEACARTECTWMMRFAELLV